MQDNERPSEDLVEGNSGDFAAQQREIIGHLYDDAFLNDCYEAIQTGHVRKALQKLTASLDERRSDSSDIEWGEFLRFCMLHPIRGIVHQDPLTIHAFEQQEQHKYGGDPELLDMIHRAGQGIGPPEGTTEMGRKIFSITTRSRACEGVRNRTRKVAEMIDRVAADRQRPNVLSVTVGYLHEAGLSQAVAERRLGHWYALDSEPASLQEIDRRYSQYGVETVPMTLQQILTVEGQWKKLDLAFSTGLFEYLRQAQGQRLTAKLFEMLRPGGQLLIANFPEELPGLGYMQCFMDLHPVCRSRSQMMGLVAEIDASQIRETVLLDVRGDEILLLKVTKN